MNPAQIRRLARRLHEDRSRRIETMLVRLTADGTIPTYKDRYRAERELADDLAAALAEYGWEYDNDGVKVEREPEVVALLARHKAVWGDPADFGLREPPEVRHVVLDDRTFDVPERLSHFKVLNPNYVWCDKHGCIHDNTLNPYGYIEDGKQDYCTLNQHRPVYVQSDDRDEEF